MSIPITRPFFGDDELRAVQRPLESGWVVQGPFVEEFERGFEAFIGTAHAVATSSCTTALHVVLAALGLRSGDEVLVPAFTWVSTANVVEYFGARPVFCDIDLASYNVEPARLEAAVGERTVGILPVHLFGLCAEMDPILALARKHGLWVVEDAACALGARIGERHAGTFGDAGCFSFHPRKSITTGEGGMITTDETELAEVARSLRDHGASRSDYDRHAETGGFLLGEYALLGYNFRLTDIQGALGCAQLARAAWILERRRALAARYDEALAAAEWLATPGVPSGFEHGYQAYVTLFRPEEPTLANVDQLHARRNALMRKLDEHGIATRQGTHAAALQRYYVEKYGIRPEDFPNAWLADRLTLALPLYPDLGEGEQDEVCARLVAAHDG